MASILRRVLRNQSQLDTRFINLLNKSQPPILSAAPPPIIVSEAVQHPIYLKPKAEDSNTNACSIFYPSFSFECFLNPNPISHPRLIFSSEDVVVGSRESPKIWADSVKKKRKKKMNKHKLKKLRKRLRRKT